MRFDELNESNYLLFAIKFYNNPQSVTREDFEVLKKIVQKQDATIKKLIKSNKTKGAKKS